MVNLLLLFFYTALFRASPAQYPAGRTTLIVSIAAMVLTNTAVTSSWYGVAQGISLALLEVLLSGGFLFACLALKQHKARFEQSLSALCGASAVMALVAWPWALEVGASQASGTAAPQWVTIGQIVLIMWSLMIWSRVLRLAAEFDAFSAAALAFGYFFFSALVFAVATPVPG